MVVDLGAGDGSFVVARAAEHPAVLVIGIDAHGRAMAPAGRQLQRRRVPNALLVEARAEELPAELDGLAGEVRVHFPWGSLLRGLLQPDPRIASGLARITRPGATVTALLSVTERERGLDLAPLDAELRGPLAERYAPFGLALSEWRPASDHEIAASRSSWAKRLGAGARREAWLLRLLAGPRPAP